MKNGGGARITHTLDFLAGKHCEEEEERKKNKKMKMKMKKKKKTKQKQEEEEDECYAKNTAK